MTRYCLVQDQDCHWYTIPLKLKASFDAMCEKAYSTEEFDDFNDQFEEYRSNGPHTLTFTDPQDE